MAYGNGPQSEIQAQHWLPQCELYQAWSFLSCVRDNQCCGLYKTHVSLAPLSKMKSQEIKFPFSSLHKWFPPNLSLRSAGVEAGPAVENSITAGICILRPFLHIFVGDRFVGLSRLHVLVWKQQLKYFIPHLIK